MFSRHLPTWASCWGCARRRANRLGVGRGDDSASSPEASTQASGDSSVALAAWQPQATGQATSSLPKTEPCDLARPRQVRGPHIAEGLSCRFHRRHALCDRPRLRRKSGADRRGFNASPAVGNGRVYVGDMEGRFYCLDGRPVNERGISTRKEINSARISTASLFGSQAGLLLTRRLAGWYGNTSAVRSVRAPRLPATGRSWPAATAISTSST